MGTTLTVTVYRPDRETGATRLDLDAAFTAVAEIDAMMSLYKDDSALSVLNRAAGTGPVAVPGPLTDVLDAARHYSALTGGALDITVQPLVDLWGFFDVEHAAVPDPSEIEHALSRVGADHWSVDQDANTVRLDTGTHIDLGAIAKGYAVDRAVFALKSRGVSAALVNLGGMVAVFGDAPNGETWVIGVRHPRNPTLIGELRLQEGAVATSGDYDRYFEVGGKRYSHIIDPRTGRPVEGVFSVTVIAPTAIAADALSTAAFVYGPEEGIALLTRCASIDGLFVTTGKFVRGDGADHPPPLQLALTSGLVNGGEATFIAEDLSGLTSSVSNLGQDQDTPQNDCL